jgi:bacteriocin biosynthesis cyclodehydratase domain-containing protein
MTAVDGSEGDLLPVFCQDRLDFAEVLAFNRERRAAGEAWLWATIGPVQRGYVSPVFLPHAGPCCACLLRHFQRLSPAPEFYDLLQRSERSDLPSPPHAVAPEAISILTQLVAWKLLQLGREQPPSALYRLHVLEMASMEVTSHRVLIDPECPECRCGRVG